MSSVIASVKNYDQPHPSPGRLPGSAPHYAGLFGGRGRYRSALWAAVYGQGLGL